MGGKKKLNLKQMERMQDRKPEQQDKKKEKSGPPKEKKALAVVPPDVKNEKILAEIKKMHVLTPFAVATRYGIRISAAKDFLDELQQNGTIQLVSGSHNIKIYRAD
jgi:small subunit ribosomal protein S25e